MATMTGRKCPATKQAKAQKPDKGKAKGQGTEPENAPPIHCAYRRMIALADLKPNPRNPNKHPEAQLRLLGKVIIKTGWRAPIVVSNRSGLITKGHGRLEAARLAGLKSAPVDFQDYASDKEELADLLADNRLAELAEMELPEVKALLAELEGGDFDLDLTGYDADAIADLMAQIEPDEAKDAEPQIDRAAELNKKWKVKAGDLWAVGKHRLICGDSTKREDILRLFGGEKMQLCFTDPPYGADIEYDTHKDTQAALDKLVAGFFPLAQESCKVVALTPGVANLFKYPTPTWLLCWFYAAGTGRSPWGFTAWQPIAVWGKDPKLAAGEGCAPDGFQFMMSKEDAQMNKKLGHACPKPTSVWLRFLERLTNKQTRNVFEPFTGSGTTMVCCENLSRRCFGVEISPGYCAVILQRMADAFPALEIKRLP